MQTKYKSVNATRKTKSELKKCEQCNKPFKPKTAEQRFCCFVCKREWVNLNGLTMPGSLKGVKTIPLRAKQADLPEESLQDDDLQWSARCEYWEKECQTFTQSKKSSQPFGIERKPLILTGHGVKLRAERGALFIRNGFTHYSQKPQEWKLFPGQWRLPSRILLIDTDGYLTMSVINWLSQQNLPLVSLNWKGEVVSIIGGNGSAFDSEIRQAQLEALTNGKGREIAIQLVKDKIRESINTLRMLAAKYPCRNALSHLEAILKGLPAKVDDTRSLMLMEAQAAHHYFKAWQPVPIQWSTTNRKPVPQDWHFVGHRESFLNAGNRNATHPMNALLNYAYAVLESQLTIATVAEGVDPSIGYLHAKRPGRAALVYDLMEPLRPKIDRVILDFVRSHTFTPTDFLLTESGVCRLHPQLARRVIESALENQIVYGVVLQTITSLKKMAEKD